MTNLCSSCGRTLKPGQGSCVCGVATPDEARSRRTVLAVMVVGVATAFLVVAGLLAALIVARRHYIAIADFTRASSTIDAPHGLPPAPHAFIPAPQKVPNLATVPTLVELPRSVPSTQPTQLAEPVVHASEKDRLLEQLRSSNGRSRKLAARALIDRGWRPADDSSKAQVFVANLDFDSAEALGESATDALLVALDDDSRGEINEQAAACLGRTLDPRAVRPLCKALADPKNPELRSAAATALGRLQDRGALPAMKQALERESVDRTKVRIDSAIKKLESTTEPDPLVAALDDDEPKVRFRAVTLLLRRKDPHAMPWLERTINGEDVADREQAIKMLQHIGDADAIKMLVARVGGKGYDGPTEAVDALVQLGTPSIAPMIAALDSMDNNARWMMVQGLARLGEPAMKQLTDTLPKSGKELRLLICRDLGGMGEREDVTHKPAEPLVAMLDDGDGEVKRAAVAGLEFLKWEPKTRDEKSRLARAKGE